jgi:FixJ family two-component response regulator
VNFDTPIVYVVDDDQSVLKAVTRLLHSDGFETQSFSSPQSFLAEYDAKRLGCIVMDLTMPEIDGLDLQRRLALKGYIKPIIFISGNSDIPSSVRAMKAGAVDFLIKPFNDKELLSTVRSAIEKDRDGLKLYSEREMFKKRFGSLTNREQQVLGQVVKGRLNKQIAGDLKIVEKTVKVHRARVMRKMGVRTLAELVQISGRLGGTSEN